MKKYDFKIPRVECHLHTMYSTLDGVSTPQEYCDRAKELGIQALAITDHGTVAGAMDFYQTCKENKITPLIGCEVYAAKRLDDTSADGRGVDHINRHHLILFAKNNIGLSNLYKITSEAHLNFDRRPIVLVDEIFKNKEGLVCTTACVLTLCNSEEWVERFKAEFGEDFYIEINPHDLCDQWDVISEAGDKKKYGFRKDPVNLQVTHNKRMIEWSKHYQIPLITTADAHYARKEDKVIQDIFIINSIGNKNGWHFSKDDFHLINANQGYELFERYGHDEYFSLEEYERSLYNAQTIVEKCKDLKLERPASLLPFPYESHRFFNKERTTNAKTLIMESIKNSPRFGLLNNPVYLDRLKFELSIIEQKGFLDYFLIVDDIIGWNLSQNYLVGPGRGSGAGCLLAYILQITHVDPIKYGLLFERFLSLDRDNYPDFDIDFDKQKETQDYIRNKYGHENTARVGAFQLMKAKTALKDAARVIKGYDFDDNSWDEKKTKEAFWEVNKLTNKLPNSASGDDDEKEKEAFLTYTDPDHANYDPELDSYLKANPDIEKAVMKILGKTKTVKAHPCAMVIGDKNLKEIVPLFLDRKEKEWVTAFNGPQCEAAGLIKFDILGLNTLRDISECATLIKERHGVDFNVHNIYNIPADDPKVIERFAAADTDTVFQFNSPGGKLALARARPTCFEDLAAVTALVRPGPSEAGMDATWAARKNGKMSMSMRFNSEGKEIVVPYSHPLLNEAFKETYGVMAYQEQIMKAFGLLGGFSPIEQNNVRRVISKSKGAEKVRAFKPKFLEYATTKLSPAWTEKEVDAFFDDCIGFGSYAFNKSHSVAYAYVGYLCQYFKTYYPVEWWAAIAMNASENDVKIMLKNMKDFFNDIDINISKERFVLAGNKVQMPLRYLKGIGASGLVNIVQNQPYQSFQDFIDRTNGRSVKKDTVMSLVLAGAFRNIEPNKSEIDLLIEYFTIKKKKKSQTELSEYVPAEVLRMRDDRGFLRQTKKELNPFFKTDWKTAYQHIWSKEIVSLDLTKDMRDRQEVVIVGEIDEVRVSKTKKGDTYAKITITDEGESIGVILWPNIYPAFKTRLLKGKVLQVKGKMNIWGNTRSVAADHIYDPEI